MRIVRMLVGTALVSWTAGMTAIAAPADMPASLFRDPPAEKEYPATGEGVRIASGGKMMNAMVYVPQGKGPHPIVVLMHGFPGNEQNLDLAQTLRRAGWGVVTFHYRGSWGSPGSFSFDRAVEDGAAVVDWVRSPSAVQHFRFDSQRVVVIGHSMGGYVAAERCAADAQLLGCVLLAPWDLSYDARHWAHATRAERERLAREEFADVDGRLYGMDARQTVDTLISQGKKWDIARLASKIARHPTLLVLATRDSDDDKALDLLPALQAEHPKALQVETIDSDHSFNDKRIRLQAVVADWLVPLQAQRGGE